MDKIKMKDYSRTEYTVKEHKNKFAEYAAGEILFYSFYV